MAMAYYDMILVCLHIHYVHIYIYIASTYTYIYIYLFISTYIYIYMYIDVASMHLGLYPKASKASRGIGRPGFRADLGVGFGAPGALGPEVMKMPRALDKSPKKTEPPIRESNTPMV